MVVDKLTLLMGVDFFITGTQVKIHQPTMEEIALMGEERFFYSLNSFTMDLERIKRILEDKDKETFEKLENSLNEYVILLQFLQTDENLKTSFETLCNLLFVNYKICLLSDGLFMESLDEKNFSSFQCDLEFFLSLKKVIQQIFKLDKIADESSLNPKGELAEKIASKMQKARKKIESLSGNQEFNILSHYISILSIGSNALNINTIKKLTIYQLYNQFERFNLYSQYMVNVQAALAGAKVDMVDWFKKI